MSGGDVADAAAREAAIRKYHVCPGVGAGPCHWCAAFRAGWDRSPRLATYNQTAYIDGSADRRRYDRSGIVPTTDRDGNAVYGECPVCNKAQAADAQAQAGEAGR